MSIQDDLRAATPQIEFEHVEVSFPATADQDTAIKTKLRPENPENILYRIVDVKSVGSPTEFIIYRDDNTTRKPWYAGVMFLRCTQPSIKVTLELFIKREKPNA